MAVLGVVAILAIFFFLRFKPVRKPGSGPPSVKPSAAQEEPGSLRAVGEPQTEMAPAPPGREETPAKVVDSPLPAKLDVLDTAEEPSEGVPEREESSPIVDLPPDITPAGLGDVSLPPLPFSIFAGAFRRLVDAETTQRELQSNFLPAYIVPVSIHGSVAQSLYGVTQDGVWYRVLVGLYASKDDARQVLARMLEDLPGYQPEIMRFPFALDCGRFLSQDETDARQKAIEQEGFFPYQQSYPCSDGRTLHRILLGCHFSDKGGEEVADLLGEKGLFCKSMQR